MKKNAFNRLSLLNKMYNHYKYTYKLSKNV